MPKRKQLTIFINDGESEPIERIRKKFNIQQFNLIASHITLCREDEIEDLDYVLHKLSNLKFSAFEVSLGTPKRFYEG
ncbi:MAG: 2'-5' RNA ligase family protein, partial [Bacteroidota bacterium]